LPTKQRDRLELMVKEIEDNLDDVMAEKKEYFTNTDTVSKGSKLTLLSNAYSLVAYEKSVMDTIDERIKYCNPDAIL
jgi:hypothetical protein